VAYRHGLAAVFGLLPAQVQGADGADDAADDEGHEDGFYHDVLHDAISFGD